MLRNFHNKPFFFKKESYFRAEKDFRNYLRLIFNEQLLCDVRNILVYQRNKFSIPLEIYSTWKEATFLKNVNTQKRIFIRTPVEDETVEVKKSEVICLTFKPVVESCLPKYLYFSLT